MRSIAYLVRHDISKQHDMSRIDVHIVRFHSVLDLVNDRLTGGLDTQHLSDLDDMVGRCVLSDDA